MQNYSDEIIYLDNKIEELTVSLNYYKNEKKNCKNKGQSKLFQECINFINADLKILNNLKKLCNQKI